MCIGPGAECAPEQWSAQGAQLGRELWGRTRGRGAGWGRLALSGALKSGLTYGSRELGRCGGRRGWCAGAPHPLSLGYRTGLTSLFDSSGHSFLSSFPPQRIGISESVKF